MLNYCQPAGLRLHQMSPVSVGPEQCAERNLLQIAETFMFRKRILKQKRKVQVVLKLIFMVKSDILDQFHSL
jgi:hypothetical protein